MTETAAHRITGDEVVAAYRALLGREPENDAAIALHQAHPSLAELYATLARSAEFQAKTSPFYHYNSMIDAIGIIRAHGNPARGPLPGHIVNFLGVAMDVEFMPIVKHLAGTVDDAPIPASWHSDIAEWAAALRSVDLAQNSFTMVELGCGWGCWMNNCSVAAKRRGLRVFAIGVEGDPAHCDFARKALATNGISPSEYRIVQGIAAARPGTALFPKPDHDGVHWGYEPVFDSQPEFAAASASGAYDAMAMVALDEVIGDQERVDLLHMDIQGGEADLVHDCLPLLSKKVAYLVVGSHSRPIEGRLFTDLATAGWTLEIERPAILTLGPNGPVTRVDGAQGWINPNLF